MAKLFKISAIAISALIILMIIAMILLSAMVNTEKFKQGLVEHVLESTGQTLTIEGDLSVSIFPWLGFKTERISLSQPSGIDSQNLLEIAGANIGVKVLPLLQKKVEAGNIELKRPKLHYVVTSDGRTSLDALINTSEAKHNKGSTQKNTSSDFSAIAITGINIIDGKVSYEDQKENTRYEIDKLNIETGNLLANSNAPFTISAHVKPNMDNSVTTKIKGKANVDINNGILDANTIHIDIKHAGKKRTLLSTIESVLFNQKKQTLKIKSILFDSHIDTWNPQLSIPFTTINLKEKSTSEIDFSIDEKSTNTQLKGNILAKDWHKNPMLKGHISSKEVEPLAIVKKLDINYAPSDSTVFKKLSFMSYFSGTTNGFSLHSMKINLDNTQLAGDASIIDFKTPHYHFDLNLNSINLDLYAPKSDNNTEETNKNAGLAIAAPIPLFRKLAADGVFRADNLQANGAKLSNIKIGITSNNNQVIINPTAKLYDGETKGTITFTDDKKQPSLAIKNQFNGVNLAPLLEDTGITDQLSGKANIQLDINIKDDNGSQKNNGIINIAVKDGALKGIDIKKVLDDTQDKFDALRGKDTESKGENNTSGNDETRFAEMTATLHLNNNVVTNKDLKIKAPAFRVTGKGEIEIEPQTLNYLTNIIVVNTNSGQGGKERSELKGAVIPVRFYGSINAPEYEIDTRALIKENTKKEVDKKKEELKDKFKEKLLDKLLN